MQYHRQNRIRGVIGQKRRHRRFTAVVIVPLHQQPQSRQSIEKDLQGPKRRFCFVRNFRSRPFLILQDRDSLNAHPESKSGIFFAVDPAIFKDTWIDHAAAQDLHPP